MITKERLPELRAQYLESIRRTKEEIVVRGNDNYGVFSGNIANDELWTGIIGYVLDGNVAEFRQRIAAGAQLRINLLRRLVGGLPLLKAGDQRRPNCPPPDKAILKWDVSNGNFDWMLYALAAARLDLAEELASLFGTVHTEKIREAYCHAVKYILLDNIGAAKGRVADLREAAPAKGDNEYYRMLAAIVERDPNEVQHMVRVIDERHRHYVQTDAPFIGGTMHELLCMWGIGLANLARYRGVVDRIEFSSDLIPIDLLV